MLIRHPADLPVTGEDAGVPLPDAGPPSPRRLSQPVTGARGQVEAVTHCNFQRDDLTEPPLGGGGVLWEEKKLTNKNKNWMFSSSKATVFKNIWSLSFVLQIFYYLHVHLHFLVFFFVFFYPLERRNSRRDKVHPLYARLFALIYQRAFPTQHLISLAFAS